MISGGDYGECGEAKAVNLAKLDIWLEIFIDLKPKLLGFFVGLSHLIIYATLR